jgi:GT2 family glycosyltransferase
MKISVLIPTYKRPYWLKQCLLSVVNQTLKPYEVIISDNDTEKNTETEKIVYEFAKEYKFIKYEKNKENIGSVENFRKLLGMASGDLIQLLPDDDLLTPWALEELSKPLMEYEDVKIAVGKGAFVDENLNVIPNHYFFVQFYSRYPKISSNGFIEWDEFIKEVLINRSFMAGFPLIRKCDTDFDIFCFKDTTLEANADIFTHLAIMRRGGKIFFPNKITYILRIHGKNAQLEAERSLKGYRELLRFLDDDALEFFNIKHKIKQHELLKPFENLILQAATTAQLAEVSGNKQLSDEYKKLLNQTFEKIKNRSKKFVIENLQLRKTRENFSIIIITYNSEQTIKECLRRILENSKDQDEILVIDNNSKDKTPQILLEFQKKFPNIKVILNKENIGFARAVNQGIKACKNEFIVIINPDAIVVTPDWLEIFYKELKENNNVCVVVPTSDQVALFLSFYKFTSIEGEITPYLIRYFYKDYAEELESFFGFCFATRKSKIQELGMLDENLILGMEDLDISLRIKEKGYKIVLKPAVFVQHIYHVSFNSDKENAERLNQISIWNFAKRLIKKYGYGNVPTPDILILGKEEENPRNYLAFNLKGKYKFLFNFSGKPKSKNFFREKAVELMSKPQISCVTVNYFSSDDVFELADSLKNSEYEKINLIVVDNSEDNTEFKKLQDGLKEIIPGRFFVIKNENNGFAGGVNKGIKFAKENLNPKYIWILNPDMIVDKKTPFELLKTLLYTDSLVATCKVKDPKTGLCLYDGLKASEVPFTEEDIGIIPAAFLSGGNFFARVELFEKIGYLREDFFLYFEDNEFMDRMKKEGIKLIYTPYTHIWRKVKDRGFLFNPTKLYYFTKNFLFFYSEKSKTKEEFVRFLPNILNSFAQYHNQLIREEKENIKSIVIGIIHYLEGKKGKQDWQRDLDNLKNQQQNKDFKSKIKAEIYNLACELIEKPENSDKFQKLLEALYSYEFSKMVGFENAKELIPQLANQ